VFLFLGQDLEPFNFVTLRQDQGHEMDLCGEVLRRNRKKGRLLLKVSGFFQFLVAAIKSDPVPFM